MKDILGRNPEWRDLTDDVLSDLKDDMSEEMAPNSVRTICGELKAVITRNRATKPIPTKTYVSILRSKKVPTESTYLTTAELKRLHNYKPRTKREEFAKAMFMRECLTGARSVDCRLLSEANIHVVDGEEYLTYVPQKHPVEVTVPVHKWLKDYLSNDWPERFKKIRPDHLNRTISSICKHCGITQPVTEYKAGKTVTRPKYMCVTSHTGRRTFATILSLKGCPLDQIALMMGHMNGNVPNVTMTAGYIRERKKISKAVLAIFK